MGMTVNFMDNQAVTANELNSVASDISGGNTSFADGTYYGVEALNDISKEMVTSGVSKGCEVTCENETDIHISQGIAFFEDGKKVTIDADGIDLVAEAGKKNYVWLLNNNEAGTVNAKCTLDKPSGDFVNLAEVTSGGKVKKVIHRALMKNSSLLPNHYGEPITESVPESTKETNGGYEKEIDIGDSYRKMVVIASYDMIFLDWDNMLSYKDVENKGIVVKSLTDAENRSSLTLSETVSVTFLSLENNILKVKINPGYVSSSFTIHLM